MFYINSLFNTCPTFQGEELSTADLGKVFCQVRGAGTKWYFIGMLFEIPTSQLDAIDKNNPNDIYGKFKDMIKKWLELGEGCTWEAVYDALRHPTVGHKSIAEELKKWLSIPVEG